MTLRLLKLEKERDMWFKLIQALSEHFVFITENEFPFGIYLRNNKIFFLFFIKVYSISRFLGDLGISLIGTSQTKPKRGILFDEKDKSGQSNSKAIFWAGVSYFNF